MWFVNMNQRPDFSFFVMQVLSELFSSVFENEDMPTPLHPLQGSLATRLIKPPALLRSLSPLTQRPGSSTQVTAQKTNTLYLVRQMETSV